MCRTEDENMQKPALSAAEKAKASGEVTVSDESMMRLALSAAKKAGAAGEVPVGAVICRGEQILACCGNQVESTEDPSAHAELLCIREAASLLHSRYLDHCTLYVTLEPCPMCAGAILQSHLPRLVYGAADPKSGAIHSLLAIFELGLPHHPEICSGVLEEDCSNMLKSFFRKKRRINKAEGSRSVRKARAIARQQARDEAGTGREHGERNQL